MLCVSPIAGAFVLILLSLGYHLDYLPIGAAVWMAVGITVAVIACEFLLLFLIARYGCDSGSE